jgi:hypothetical protein
MKTYGGVEVELQAFLTSAPGKGVSDLFHTPITLPAAKESRVSNEWRLDESQSGPGRFRKGEKLALSEIEPQFCGQAAQSVVTITNALSWLLYVMLMAFINRFSNNSPEIKPSICQLQNYKPLGPSGYFTYNQL